MTKASGHRANESKGSTLQRTTDVENIPTSTEYSCVMETRSVEIQGQAETDRPRRKVLKTRGVGYYYECVDLLFLLS